MTPDKNKPVKEFKVGGVRAAIWANTRQTSDGKTFSTHKVQLERTYKDAQGQFKTTGSLDSEDLPKAILALTKCYEFLSLAAEKSEFESATGPRNGGGQP
jgi:hypothetical protein